MMTPLRAKTDILDMDGADLRIAYLAGELSPVEVTKAALDRARSVQADFNAFTLIDDDAAIDAAKVSEARWAAGCPKSDLDGVPTTLKDLLAVEGWTVRYGSLTTDSVPAAGDAPSVARLRSAGAVFIGQTTSSEYGWKAVTDSPAFGITRNPWNREKTPGGSSGGAAVAAVCGAGVLHLGTDGGGSLRIPASFTGVVGHKPSFGRVPFDPPSAFGTVAHVGPIARSAKDVASMLGVLSARDVRDWTQPPMDFPPAVPFRFDWMGKRIGYWKRPCVGSVDAEVASAVDRAGSVCLNSFCVFAKWIVCRFMPLPGLASAH